MRDIPLRLGPKLNLSLLMFIVLLGIATTVLVLVGFNRSQSNAAAKSREGLETEGREHLEQISQQQAYIGSLQLAPAAEWGHQSGWFLALKGQTEPAIDGSNLARTESGRLYDADPARLSDVLIPSGVELTPRVLKDLSESSVLEGFFVSLFADNESSLFEDPFRPVAIFYTSIDGMTRYYPPTNSLLESNITVEDLAKMHAEIGGQNNPGQRTIWTPPYIDEAGRGAVLTAYTPIYDETGYRGVIGVDVSLELLKTTVDGLAPTPGGFAFYLDQEGNFLQTDKFDVVTALAAEGANPAFRAALDDMLKNNADVARFEIDGRDYFVAYAPLDPVGGSLGLVAPVDELTTVAAGVTDSIESEGNRTLGFIILVMIFLFLLALASTAWLNRHMLLLPIEALVSGTRAVAAGNFSATIPVRSHDELGDLAASFNRMTEEVRTRNDALVREIAEREQTARALAEREESTRQIFQSVSDAIFITDMQDRVVDANVAAQQMYGYTLAELQALEPFSLIHPASRGGTEEFLALLAEGKQFRSRAIGLRKDGSTFMSDAFATKAMYFGKPHILSVIRDVTEEVAQQQLLERRVDERTRELSLLLQISTTAASTLDPAELFEMILEQVAHVVPYDGATILVAEDGFMTITANRASEGAQVAGVRFSTKSLQAALENGPVRPLRLDDIRGDDRLAKAFREQVEEQMETVFGGVTSFLGAPMQRQGRLIGQIALTSQRRGAFSEADAALVQAIANQAATAIENARLFAESERRAAEMTALSRIATTLDLEQSVETTLSSVAKRVVESTGAVAASLSTVGPDGLLKLGGSYGLPAGFFKAVETAVKKGAPRPSETAIRSGQAVIVKDVRRLAGSHPAFDEVRGLLAEVEWDDIVIVPLRYGDRELGTLETYFRPAEFPDDREISLVTAMASQAATAIENAVLFSQTEKRVRQLEALTAIASTFSLEVSINELMDRMAEQIVRATTCVAAAVTLADGPEGDMRMIGVARTPEGFAEQMEDAYRRGGGSTTRLAMETMQTIYQEDLRRQRIEDPRYVAVSEKLKAQPWDSVLLAPIIFGNQSLGVLMLAYPLGVDPEAEERKFVEAVADQTALVIENARLYQRASSAAALEERQRLARELHDSVSQALYGIALGARTARRRLGEEAPSSVTEPLDYVLSLAEAGLTEMRALIFELRPESLATEGLVAAIGRQVAATQARYGVEVTAELCDEPDVSLDIKEALYRIAQESMHNTVKHARATRVTVGLECDDTELELFVQDNGQGFDPAGEFPGHLGLRSMKERVRDIGGSLEIDSEPGKGTRINVRVPL